MTKTETIIKNQTFDKLIKDLGIKRKTNSERFYDWYIKSGGDFSNWEQTERAFNKIIEY